MWLLICHIFWFHFLNSYHYQLRSSKGIYQSFRLLTLSLFSRMLRVFRKDEAKELVNLFHFQTGTIELLSNKLDLYTNCWLKFHGLSPVPAKTKYQIDTPANQTINEGPKQQKWQQVRSGLFPAKCALTHQNPCYLCSDQIVLNL